MGDHSFFLPVVYGGWAFSQKNGSTLARFQNDLVSELEFNSVELKTVAVNMLQIITNRFCWLLECIYNLWIKFDTEVARHLKPSRDQAVEFNLINRVRHGRSTTFETGLKVVEKRNSVEENSRLQRGSIDP